MAHTFGFKDTPWASFRKQLYLKLLVDNAYTYAVSCSNLCPSSQSNSVVYVQDPVELDGIYQGGICFSGCKATWFASKSGDGVVWQGIVKPFTTETIALCVYRCELFDY